MWRRFMRYFSRPLIRFLQYVVVGTLIVYALLAINDKSKQSRDVDPANYNPKGGQQGGNDGGGGRAFVAPEAPFADVQQINDDQQQQRQHKKIERDLNDLEKNGNGNLKSWENKDNLGPKPGSSEYESMPRDRDWTDYEQMAADQLRSGPGEQGKPVVLGKDPETENLENSIYRVNGFDGLVSDHIALNRSVKDIRHSACRQKRYLQKLPSISVILPFHNEHNSTLLRSVYSVLNRSPKGVVREVILVDDASTKEFLKDQLEDYCPKNLPMVKIVRCAKREGLIRARQIGAQHATMDIMIFLDSHSEANYNWIPPLVQPIALNYRVVVCPFVDVLDCDTMEYRAQDEGARGSFDWEFNYKRLPLTAEDQKDPSKPFRSPVMAGGYFAISRKWFWELGGYDEGLDIWGGEQYELSFKVWQCHGEMYDAPCSRVGHIYRCKYVPFANPGVGDFISRNYKRVAEVWMDDYKEYLYKRRPGMRNTDARDLTKQKEVRDRLKCKSFDWFMKEIAFDQDKFYPAVEPPNGAYGPIRNLAVDKCIDTQFKGKDDRFGLQECSVHGGGEQKMKFSFWKDIRAGGRTMCFDCSTSTPRAKIVLYPCHGMQGNQAWKYRSNTQQIYHPLSRQCLDCDKVRAWYNLRTLFACTGKWRHQICKICTVCYRSHGFIVYIRWGTYNDRIFGY